LSPSIGTFPVLFCGKGKAMKTTVVIFRIDREGIVFALFPELPSDNYGTYCTCYQHIGQHCAADYHRCMAHSRPATANEYADLLTELEGRGYRLDVHRRANPVLHERRRWLAATSAIQSR
jgi:hypothetical protein